MTQGAKQKGLDVTIQVDIDGTGNFLILGGLQTKSFSINNEIVEVTDSESPNRWRELIGGAGTKSVSITGDGFYETTQACTGILQNALENSTLLNLRFIIPGYAMLEMPTYVTAVNLGGNYNEAVTLSYSWENAGEVVQMAIPDVP